MVNIEPLSRTTKTCKQLVEQGLPCRIDEEKVLLEPAEFIKLVKHLYGTDIDRPTLQLYSTPRFQLLPPPVHRGGHVSYYLNPEHTQRLGALLHMRDKLHMQLKDIREVLDVFPADYYHLILSGVLADDELLDFPVLLKEGYNVKDVVFYKITEMLAAVDKNYWEFIGKEGQQAPRDVERVLHKRVSKDLKDLAGWLRTDCRMDIYEILDNERRERSLVKEGKK